MPECKPVTKPVVSITLAVSIRLLVQVPPGVRSVSAVVEPTHTPSVPVIAGSDDVTVITTERVQPDGEVYITVEVPEATPLTTPVDDPTVATEVVLLLQVPPVVASVSVLVKPTHIDGVPVIGLIGLIVAIAVALALPQLLLTV